MNASTSAWSRNLSRNSGALTLPVGGPRRLGQGLQGRVGGVVALVRAQDLAAHPVEHAGLEPDRPAGHERAELGGGVRDDVTGGAGQHPADPQRALDRRRRGRVEACGGDTLHDVAERAQRHRLLAEGGQHPLDVRRVGAGGADDEDAPGLEPAAVGVQQVRRPVQRHHGLAGARPAGDLGDAAGGCPDRLVLVALDGGDDVAHAGAAGAGQRRHQRAVADHHEVLGRLRHHQVVLDPDDVRALAPQHPAAQHAHRLDRGGAVERRRGRRAPVDDQRLVLVVAHTEPADVAHLALGGAVAADVVLEVEPAEHQALVLRLEGGAAPVGAEHQRIALEQPGDLLVADVAGAVGPAAGQALGLDQRDPGGRLGQLVVHAVDVGLLDGDLGRHLIGGRRGLGVRVVRRGHWSAWIVRAGKRARRAPLRHANA